MKTNNGNNSKKLREKNEIYNKKSLCVRIYTTKIINYNAMICKIIEILYYIIV